MVVFRLDIWLGIALGIFCSFLASTVVVGIFPTAFFVMLNRNRFLASHLQEAMEMNQYLQKAESIPNVIGWKTGRSILYFPEERKNRLN